MQAKLDSDGINKLRDVAISQGRAGLCDVH